MTIPNHYMWMYRDKTILYMVKLTLRLSCAMNFAIYPHDTQECKLQMESCKYMWEHAKCMCGGGGLSALKIDTFAHFSESIELRHCNLCVCTVIFLFPHLSRGMLKIVSHTTDDMIFQWDPSVPLVVDDNIELPQLALVKNHTADCKFWKKKNLLKIVQTSRCDFFIVFRDILQALKFIQPEISHALKWFLC